MEAGLMGASFFISRLLSNPFSLGEWAGLPRGDAGSCITVCYICSQGVDRNHFAWHRLLVLIDTPPPPQSACSWIHDTAC